MSAKASLSFDIYLRAAPQQVRAVLADPALAPRWLAGTTEENRWVWRLCAANTGPRVQASVHQVVPGGFGHVDVEVGGGAADVLEGEGAVGVGDVLDLIETGQGGADVAG